jgi:tetratricopeptide (TPR) repeat protein
MFKLNKNFRSHQGIISLASFVMKLLYTGFPETVDKMEEERGQYAGPIPTLFLGFGAQILGSRLVGLQDVNDVHIADFGAEQVILVRDEQQKEKVQQEIGDLALVLTILDSKGMEFDDVFLLDFFTSSPKPATLRRLRCILAEDAMVLQQETIGMDGLLCSELKHLYVAVTRPRNQLWIFESDAKVVEPVVMLLAGDTGERKDGSDHSKQPLVEVVGKDHPQLKQKLKMLKPAESSDPKKYSEMGYQLIQRGLFKDASFCFRKAKDERGQTIAKAHLSMEEGRGFRASGNNKEFIRLFIVSVDLFKQADQLGNAAFCLEEMNHLEEAGDIWISILRHDKAAPLYMQARCWLKASTSFDIIERYGDAAAALRQGELFNELVNYISRNRDLLEPAQTASYGKLCAILVAQGRIKQEMQEHIVDLMGTEREKEEFYRKFKMSTPLVALLKKKAEFGAAVQELIYDGKPVDALELGLDHVGEDPTINQQEIVKLINYIEYRRLLRLCFQLVPDKNNVKPVEKYTRLPLQIYDTLHSWQTLFTDIQQRTLRKVFKELPNGSMVKDILSCTIAIHGDKRIAIETIRESQFAMDALVVATNIWNSVRTDDQELPLPLAIVVGAYQLSQSNEVLLLDYTPISTENLEKKHSKWIDITPKVLSGLLERMLPFYLRLDETLSPLWKSEARPSCQNFTVYGQCARPDTCKRHHSKAISREIAQSRVEVSLTIYKHVIPVY